VYWGFGFCGAEEQYGVEFEDVAVVGWFFIAVGVADFDCGFGGDSFCGDVEFAVFFWEPEQHCYFVAWDPGLDWFAKESLSDDVEWVLVPCWGFCWGGGFFGGCFGEVGKKFKFYIVDNCLPWVGDY